MLMLISGDRGNGKTRALLRICRKMARLQNRKFDVKTDLYFTEVGNLAYRVMTEENLIIGIDEGYFAAKNTKVLEKKVSDLIDVMTAGRNRGHVIIINFVKFTRAAKTLLEVCNFWMHKPNEDWGILYVRDREFIGDDPWSVEDILKAKNLHVKRWMMRHNPNYMTTMRIRRLSNEIFDEYEKLKLERQSEYAKAMKLRNQLDQQLEYISDKLYERYKVGDIIIDMHNMTKTDKLLRDYLSRVHNIPTTYAKAYLDKFKERLIREGVFKQLQADEESTQSF